MSCALVLDQETTVSHWGDPWHPIACGSAAREQMQGGAERAPGVGRGLHPDYRLRTPHSSWLRSFHGPSHLRSGRGSRGSEAAPPEYL